MYIDNKKKKKVIKKLEELQKNNKEAYRLAVKPKITFYDFIIFFIASSSR
jgi:hypothetical protein